MQTTEPILFADHLVKHYGTIVAVSDGTLRVHPGEVLALVGDNGAGKSTVVKMLSGAVVPTGGRIILDGHEQHFQSPLDARHAGIETVYQDLALAPHLNIVENMFLGRPDISNNLLGRLLGQLDMATMRQRAAAALDDLKVTVKSLDQPVAKLSGGQRQAVAIARAVLWGKKLLILDEPTNHLGVHEVDMVLGLVQRVSASGVGVVYISHTLPHVFQIATHIAVMRLGRTVALLDTPRTDMDAVVAYITGTRAAA